MANSVNKVILVGRLGKDPEVKYTQGGTPVAKFTVATNEVWKDQNGEKQERTEWHNIVAWTKLAEICGQYLNKGSRVYIEGRIQTRSWEDKEGNRKFATEVVGDNLIMLDKRTDGGASVQPSEHSGIEGTTGTETPPEAGGDLPF